MCREVSITFVLLIPQYMRENTQFILNINRETFLTAFYHTYSWYIASAFADHCILLCLTDYEFIASKLLNIPPSLLKKDNLRKWSVIDDKLAIF